VFDASTGQPAQSDAASIRVGSRKGSILIKVFTRGDYRAVLAAIDAAGVKVTVLEWRFRGRAIDTADKRNGPNGKGCNHGIVNDTVAFDEVFACSCERTRFTGENCEVEADEQDTGGADASTSGGMSAASEWTIGVLCALIGVALLSVALVARCRRAASLRSVRSICRRA